MYRVGNRTSGWHRIHGQPVVRSRYFAPPDRPPTAGVTSASTVSTAAAPIPCSCGSGPHAEFRCHRMSFDPGETDRRCSRRPVVRHETCDLQFTGGRQHIGLVQTLVIGEVLDSEHNAQWVADPASPFCEVRVRGPARILRPVPGRHRCTWSRDRSGPRDGPSRAAVSRGCGRRWRRRGGPARCRSRWD